MKSLLLLLSSMFLGVVLLLPTGCQTETVGTKSFMGTYTSMVDSTPDKVTKAAAKAAEELKLTDVQSTATKIDGKMVAKTAQRDDVTINVEQAGENVSKVSIRVGTTGDEATSKMLLDKIKGNLHWF